MRVCSTLALLIALAACGGSTSNTGPTTDAPSSPPGDAPRSDAAVNPDAMRPDAAIDAAITATVVAVTCPATPAAAITANDNNDTTYMPSSVTISVGQIVKFT